LLTFLQWYELAQPTKTGRGSERFPIAKYDKWVRKRKFPCVIRTPKFSPSSEAYYYSLVMLAIPHKDEAELIPPYLDAKGAFAKKLSDSDGDFNAQLFHLSDEIEQAIQNMRLATAELENLAFEVPEINSAATSNLHTANISVPYNDSIDCINVDVSAAMAGDTCNVYLSMLMRTWLK
jgi:hypothetical protein